MKYDLIPFSKDHIEPAIDLFKNNYDNEKEKSCILPLLSKKQTERIISSIAGKSGVAVTIHGELSAYMITGDTFSFKGQKACIVNEYCHCSIGENKNDLYKLMYMSLSSEWIKLGAHLHLIGHFAHDLHLKDILFETGFGAILSEKLRDVTPIKSNSSFKIIEENEPEKLIDLHTEHYRYYPKAPIFILKNTDHDAILKELYEYKSKRDIFLVYYEENHPAGYFIVGESVKGGEGFLLMETNTAQIKSAFVKPSFRGKGIGECLLHETICHANKNYYERIFVEHETANFFGGNFWSKHFTPYLYYSMRYIDCAI